MPKGRGKNGNGGRNGSSLSRNTGRGNTRSRSVRTGSISRRSSTRARSTGAQRNRHMEEREEY